MRQALLVASRNVRLQPSSLVRVSRRRLATGKPETVVVPKGTTVAAPIPEPVVVKRKRTSLTVRMIQALFALTTLYAVDLYFAFKYPAFYDFTFDKIPFGQPLIEFAESRGWDLLVTPKARAQPSVKSAVEKKLEETKAMVEKKASEANAAVSKQVSNITSPPPAKTSVSSKTEEAKEKAKQVADSAREKLQKSVAQKLEKAKDKLDTASDKAGWVARHQAGQLADDLADLKVQAEAALRGDYPVSVKRIAAEVKEKVEEVVSSITSPPAPSQPVYPGLPLGFEPPKGYAAPKPSSPSRPSSGPPPGTSLRSDPTPLPGSVPYPNAPSKPKSTPASPAELEKQLKEAERLLDEQVRETNLKLIEFELSAQDALDKQETDFKRALISEREKISDMYRQKMEEELKVQRDLIEERLKETLAAQSVELQRRWIREIKVLVEEERGGRLSKLTEIQTKLKALESVALDNAAVLDDAARSKALLGAVDVFKRASFDGPSKKAFRDELRTLRTLALESKDELFVSALDSLDKSNTPDVGVEPLPDLAAWFMTSVSPKAAKMALVPSQDAGLISHLASSALSSVTFKRLDEGQLKNRADGGGDDVLSTLSRTEWYLKMDGLEGLEKATRELNQLPPGPSREICEDWLSEARRRLEVGMLVETLESLATIKALLYSA